MARTLVSPSQLLALNKLIAHAARRHELDPDRPVDLLSPQHSKLITAEEGDMRVLNALMDQDGDGLVSDCDNQLSKFFWGNRPCNERLEDLFSWYQHQHKQTPIHSLLSSIITTTSERLLKLCRVLQVEVEKSDMLVPSELDLRDYQEFLEEWELDKLFAIAFANQTVRRWVGMMCLVDTEPCQSINMHKPEQQKPVELPDNELGEVENLEEYCIEVRNKHQRVAMELKRLKEQRAFAACGSSPIVTSQDLKEHEASVHSLLLCLKYNNDRTAVGVREECFADAEQYNAERKQEIARRLQEMHEESNSSLERMLRKESPSPDDPQAEHEITKSVMKFAGSLLQFFSLDDKQKKENQPRTQKQAAAPEDPGRERLRKDFFDNEFRSSKTQVEG
uniref:Uncharacterized protein n=1 Tax=Guillardia theta TaxID=55529 RepID=A0A6U5Z5D7_GUITH